MHSHMNTQKKDYHMFVSLKEALRGQRFFSDDEVKGAVHTCLWSQPFTFCRRGQKICVLLHNLR